MSKQLANSGTVKSASAVSYAFKLARKSVEHRSYVPKNVRETTYPKQKTSVSK
ncbi:MAG: hypothetical protein JJ895_06465 [Balneolaceae bacterium]|nr:hypothetical protein [Balneolaceae bacterium]